jgi:hypothetical protein
MKQMKHWVLNLKKPKTQIRIEYLTQNIKSSWRQLSSHIRFKLGDGSKIISDMMCGVRIKPSRSLFGTCQIWPNLRKLSWETVWISLMPLISEILTFL